MSHRVSFRFRNGLGIYLLTAALPGMMVEVLVSVCRKGIKDDEICVLEDIISKICSYVRDRGVGLQMFGRRSARLLLVGWLQYLGAKVLFSLAPWYLSRLIRGDDNNTKSLSLLRPFSSSPKSS